MTAALNFGAPHAETLRAAQIVESVVGNAWATDAAGNFTYVTPATLAVLGVNLGEINSRSDEYAFGWKRVVHPDDCDGAAAAWRRCLQTGEHYNFEHRMLRASGAYSWARSSGQPLRDDASRIVGWYGTIIDGIPSPNDGGFADIASSAVEEPPAPDAPHALGLIHPDDRTAAAHAAARAFWTGVPQVTRHRQLQPDGSYRWTETRSEPGYSLSVDIDDLVTDREPPAGAAIPLDDHGSEAIRAATVVESIFGNGWAFDAAGRWIYLHPFAQNSLGVTLEYLNAALDEGHTAWKRLLHPDDYEQVAEAWRHCLETGDHFNVEFRFRRASGVYVWARTAARPARDGDGRIAGWFGIALDIDVYKKTMAALRDRERELSRLVDMVPSHIWRLAPNGEPIFFNKRMVEFLGSTVADMDKPGISRLDALTKFVHSEDAAVFREALRVCLVSGERFSIRYRLRRSDGAYRWMSSRAEPMRDEGGRVLQWYGLCHDIDDQVKAEEALRRSERQLQQTVDAVPALIWCTTPQGAPSYINKRLMDTVGVRLEDLTGPDASRSLADIHPDDKQVVEDALTRSFETGTPFAMMYRQRRSDGDHRWTEGRAEPFRGESGEIVQWYGVCIDMHDLVTAQRTLHNRERELSQLVDMVPSLLWRLSPEGEPNFFNKRLVDFLGVDVSDADTSGKSRLAAVVEAIVHPDDAAKVAEALRHSIATGERFSMRYRLRRADGVYRWVAGSAEPLRDQEGRIVQWYGLSHDIDDQLQAEEALQSSKRQLEQMIDAVPFSILSFAPSGKMTYTSKRYLEQAGPPAANIEDFEALARDVVHPEDFPIMFRKARDGFATGQPFVNRFRRRLKNGGYRWIEARAQPLRDAYGAIVQWYIASIDIEDEMRAQEALRARERFLWQLVETLPAMIDCAAPDGEPVYRSRQLRDFLGYDLEQLDSTGKSRLAGTLDTGVHPDDVAGVKELYAHSLATGVPYLRRHRLRRFDGEYRWVETRASPMRDAEGTIIQWNVICLDIDSEVRAQEALRLAQDRLARASQAASLAELSASIAHEVNQPLAAIVANSHACHRWLSATPPNLERAKITAERIIRDANSAADVVSRIRALFKQSTESRSSAAVATVIAEARDLMAEEALRRRIRMDVEVDGLLPMVVLDRTQIQQVLVNLLRNGMEAMEGTATGGALRTRAGRAAEGIWIEVSDSGRGLDDVDNIFDPFFTTKRNGMGMGLAICRSIVESHGGRLWAEKNEPQGAKFIFTLPVEPKEES